MPWRYASYSTNGLEEKSMRLGRYSRGYHPHFNTDTNLQSVTFRLQDSVPANVVHQWRDELSRVSSDHEKKAKLQERLIRYEDAGHGACHLRNPQIAELVENALLHFDGDWYRLLEWCVMPNHVHSLVETMPDREIGRIVQSWKSFTAKEANRLLHRTGTFWMADYHDRYIRDERHLTAIRTYIRNNPVKAGLCLRPDDWRFSSAWRGRQSDR
jgi:REP element-mobilizing transposase RayT